MSVFQTYAKWGRTRFIAHADIGFIAGWGAAPDQLVVLQNFEETLVAWGARLNPYRVTWVEALELHLEYP